MGRVGIRREDKNRWERRAPLTPDHVADLVDNHGLELVVQPSAVRAFSDRDYVAAGARIDEDLGGCDLILGVKEIPAEQLQPGRVHVFFSHTSKGQPHNMPMLRRLLEIGSTLIDYEHVRDERGRRLIFFGRFAGYAGMIDALWALGRRLEAEGHVTPFVQMRLAHDYSSLDEATHHVARIGEQLRHVGVSEGLRPIVCAFTGSGNVARGALEIFDRLPWVELDPDELASFADDPQRPRNVVYRVTLGRAQRFERRDGGAVDLEELQRHPERYRSAMPRWLPHVTLLVHGAYWLPSQPRLVSLDDLRRYWRGAERHKLRVIADISCDIDGGIEATRRPTTPAEPVYVYDVERDATVDGVHGAGPVILAIDNLPCQLPVESSQHFGDTLARFVPRLASCDWRRPLSELELPRAIRDAVVAHRGRLTPAFAGLERHLG